jgi:hypothetical protein
MALHIPLIAFTPGGTLMPKVAAVLDTMEFDVAQSTDAVETQKTHSLSLLAEALLNNDQTLTPSTQRTLTGCYSKTSLFSIGETTNEETEERDDSSCGRLHRSASGSTLVDEGESDEDCTSQLSNPEQDDDFAMHPFMKDDMGRKDKEEYCTCSVQ